MTVYSYDSAGNLLNDGSHAYTEESKGGNVIQNPKPVTTNANGQVFHLVSLGAFTEKKVERDRDQRI